MENHTDRIWLSVHGDLRNLDWIPDRCLPVTGCSACGSAYVELNAIAVSSEIVDVTSDVFTYVSERRDYLRGVQLLCFEGHIQMCTPTSQPGILNMSILIKGWEMPAGWKHYLADQAAKVIDETPTEPPKSRLDEVADILVRALARSRRKT